MIDDPAEEGQGPYAHLAIDDMRHILRAMPKDARSAMIEAAKHRFVPHTIFLAGGAIRSIIAGETVSDWDFLGPDVASLDRFIVTVKADRTSTPSRVYKTKNALTLLSLAHTPIQAITRWTYQDPELLLAEFDFTIAKAVMWFDGERWRSLADRRFYKDLAAKRLRYTAPNREEDAGGSMLRALKFVRRGYAISPENLALVIGRLCASWRPDSGIDLSKVVAGLLREVDPLTTFDGLDADEDDTDPMLTERDTQAKEATDAT